MKGWDRKAALGLSKHSFRLCSSPALWLEVLQLWIKCHALQLHQNLGLSERQQCRSFRIVESYNHVFDLIEVPLAWYLHVMIESHLVTPE